MDAAAAIQERASSSRQSMMRRTMMGDLAPAARSRRRSSQLAPCGVPSPPCLPNLPVLPSVEESIITDASSIGQCSIVANGTEFPDKQKFPNGFQFSRRDSSLSPPPHRRKPTPPKKPKPKIPKKPKLPKVTAPPLIDQTATCAERSGDMEPPRDTLVRLSEYDEERSSSNSCCCGAVHIRHGTIAIALLSLCSAAINGVLVCMGISRTALNFFVEVGVLFADVIAVVALFYGVIYRKPAFLKPYMFVNIIWNLVLVLLFLLCIAQLIKDEEMSKNIMWNALEVSSFRPRRAQIKTVATLATVVMITGLFVTIIINFWFLFVVFSCFQWMNAYGVKITDISRPITTEDPFSIKPIQGLPIDLPKRSDSLFSIQNPVTDL